MSKLDWKTWEGTLPKGAVNILNSYCNRIDYVSKPLGSPNCGYYTPEKGPFCYYPWNLLENKTSSFEILVNEDEFEDLVWVDGSNGSVPQNAVESCGGLYVGKNKYGLGKVQPDRCLFYLPWNGKEYSYSNYQVLAWTIDNVKSDVLSGVLYQTENAKIVPLPPEVFQSFEITNSSDTEVTKTTAFEETTVNESKWDITHSKTLSVNVTISSKIPSVIGMQVSVGAEETFTYSMGSLRREEKKWSDRATYTVKPKKTIDLEIVVSKCKVNIPFTALLTRTYNNGKVRTTNISGTYSGACANKVKAEVKDGEWKAETGGTETDSA